MVPFPLKPLKSCCCIFFLFWWHKLFPLNRVKRVTFLLCCYSTGIKPKLYNNSPLFPMSSQTHEPLLLNTLTPSSQIFWTEIQWQRTGLFQGSEAKWKVKSCQDTKDGESKYERAWSLQSHAQGKNCFAFPPGSVKYAELKGIPIVTCMIKEREQRL